MEAALLLADALGVLLVLVWVMRARGRDGPLGWRAAPRKGRARPGA